MIYDVDVPKISPRRYPLFLYQSYSLIHQLRKLCLEDIPTIVRIWGGTPKWMVYKVKSY